MLKPVTVFIALLVLGACGNDDDSTATTSLPNGVPTNSLATTSTLISASTSTSASSTASASSSTRNPTCSASSLVGTIDEQPGAPSAVGATRRAIVAAATACEYDALARLGSAGTRAFSFSFGASVDAAAYWRRLETDRTAEPMRYLVELLKRPRGDRDGGDAQRQYVWPSAFAYERWSDVPQSHRDALRPLYGDAQFEQFARFGSYSGYRIGISADGEWLFFIASD